MIKIAIVDDEEYSAIKCRNIISSARIPDTQIDIFNDGKHFSKVVFDNKEPFDIIILDIDMPEITGFDIAKRLREEYPDVIIMFYTAYDQYVFKSFEFQPFRYIRKIKIEVELPSAIKEAIKRITSQTAKYIVLNYKDGEIKVSASDIMYFEAFKRNVILHLISGERITVYISVNELLDKIQLSKFIMIHRSCVVNSEFVQRISNDLLLMKNGEKLFVSRRKIKEVRTMIINEWGENVD